ncbi:MAG: SusC/RagA family TonB-linked outer membrane protein [Carboxylicivirga sp.]|nr:SusC/RagA family TonB-linked outer membrane protein [Carboxylicivirga sp.]
MKKINIALCMCLLWALGLHSFAQSNVLTGRLLDENKNPIGGAKVELLNSDVVVFTNTKGQYTITGSEGDTARVSTITNFAKDIVLALDLVTVLDLKHKPLENGNGIIKHNSKTAMNGNSVFANQLEKSTGHIATSNALIGELPGLIARSSSGFASENNAKLNFRGMGTPLILIDGFERNIDDINVDEIESVTLLKDAASMAIYGYKSSAGVMSITTKRGKYDGIEIGFSYNHSVNFAQPFEKMVNAFDYANGINEALVNDGLPKRYNNYQLDAYQFNKDPNVYANVNWANEALKDVAHSNSYDFNVRGGGKFIRYYSSVALDTDNGFVGVDAPDSSVPNQFKYSNLNVRSNLDITLSKSTLLSLNLLAKLNENSSPLLGDSDLMKTLYDTPSAAFPVKTANGEWAASTIWKTNPIADLKTAGFSKYHTRMLWTDFAIDQKLDVIVKGLRAKVSFAYDSYSRIYEDKKKAYRTETITTPFDEAGNPLEVEYSQVGENEASYSFRSWLNNQAQHTTVKGLLDYTTTIGRSILNVGYLTQYTHLVGLGIQKTYNRSNHSLFMSYKYDDRFILDGTVTAAASNVLNPEDQWGYFPAVSSAWIISNERALKDSKAVNFLKLSASWGMTGSDDVGFNKYEQAYSKGKSYYFGNYVSTPTLELGTLPVNNLTYERNTMINIGLEGSLYDHFNFAVDVYQNRMTDLLTNIDDINSAVVGVNPGKANNGEIKYKGYEIAAGYNNNLGDFKYSLHGQFSKVKSEIVNMNEQARKNDFNRQTGHAVGQVFGLEAVGFFKDKADIASSDMHTFTQVQPGDIKYKDQDGNGIIDEHDKVALGYSKDIPEIYYSFGANIEYKNLGLNLMFQGVSNYSTILNIDSYYRPLVDNKNISQHYYDNRWSNGNDDALYPRLTTQENENNEQVSTVWLQDKSYLKLRCAELYYNLPSQWLSGINISKTKVFVRGYNLLSFDKMKMGDAESVGRNYPMYRTVNFGVNVSF